MSVVAGACVGSGGVCVTGGREGVSVLTEEVGVFSDFGSGADPNSWLPTSVMVRRITLPKSRTNPHPEAPATIQTIVLRWRRFLRGFLVGLSSGVGSSIVCSTASTLVTASSAGMSFVPHLMQKTAPSALGVPHEGQKLGRSAWWSFGSSGVCVSMVYLLCSRPPSS
jgi:hypothetical protein